MIQIETAVGIPAARLPAADLQAQRVESGDRQAPCWFALHSWHTRSPLAAALLVKVIERLPSGCNRSEQWIDDLLRMTPVLPLRPAHQHGHQGISLRARDMSLDSIV